MRKWVILNMYHQRIYTILTLLAKSARTGARNLRWHRSYLPEPPVRTYMIPSINSISIVELSWLLCSTPQRRVLCLTCIFKVCEGKIVIRTFLFFEAPSGVGTCALLLLVWWRPWPGRSWSVWVSDDVSEWLCVCCEYVMCRYKCTCMSEWVSECSSARQAERERKGG